MRSLITAPASVIACLLSLLPGATNHSHTGSLWLQSNMLTPRTSQSAVALGPGKLLVLGGETIGNSLFGDPTNTAEAYNLKTNSWRFVGAMATSRVGQIAVGLSNGRVLVAGGNDEDGTPLASAEVFSTKTNTWSIVTPMPHPAAEQSAVLLKNGKALVMGGIVSGHVSAEALLFNPRTNRWELAPRMKDARAGAESVVLQHGDVLVAGGTSPNAEIYVPSQNRWRYAGQPGKRLFPALVVANRSDVLMAGGRVADGGCLKSAKLYTGGTQWRPVPAMESPRCAPLSTSLPGTGALVGGGFGSTTYATVQQFDDKSRRWRPFPSLPGPRAAGSLTYLGGWIVAAGGTAEGDEISTAESRRLSTP